jgi:hypothetical protein
MAPLKGATCPIFIVSGFCEHAVAIIAKANTVNGVFTCSSLKKYEKK